MRKNIVKPGADEFHYEIREIVAVAKEVEKKGLRVTWENIGDPVAKGERIPGWIKKIVHETIMDDKSYAYSPTKGVDETREFIAEMTNKRGKIKITKEDIIFFNGLGDAISKVYGLLKKEARMIGPTPAYTTHSSSEAAHADSPPFTYILDPKNNWYPDIEDLRNKVRYNPTIVGIIMINPNNPTGAVYPLKIVKEIVKIAKEYDLFITCDEIYTNIIYNKTTSIPLSDVIKEVPGISMKGISKEFPWPGARCGWIEVYNQDKDPIFKRYIQSIIDDKMLEVCSTTLPQMVIPKVISDPRYKEYHKERNKIFEERANFAFDVLKDVNEIIVNRTNGAFYMSVIFKDGILSDKQKLEIEDQAIKEYIEGITKNVTLDKRFVYYLLGSTGICVVPMTGFESDLNGFRLTLLETDKEKFEWTIKTLKEKIEEYTVT